MITVVTENMLKLKGNSVELNGVRPELVVAMVVAAGVFAQFGQDCIITSVTDGEHSATSLHYAGCAFDIRTRVFSGTDAVEQVVIMLKESLNCDFDVVLEPTHIHVEYQPRKR